MQTRELFSDCAYASERSNPIQAPNFFIVGAPRCGTTALYRWLKHHPRIYLPAIKECHFFADDFPLYRTVHNQEAYAKLFHGVSRCHQAIGEASVMYLYSRVAIENLLAFNPAARIVVTLRNPLEMLPSWHEQLLVTQQEDVSEFDRAWTLQSERCTGESIPPTCTIPQSLQYAEIGRLGFYVQRLLQICKRHQIYFVVYDDLNNHPADTYQGLLAWLGVDCDGRSDFSKVNQNREISAPWLRRLWPRTRPIRQRLQVVRRGIGDALYNRTRDMIMLRLSRPKQRQQLSQKMRKFLLNEYQQDINLLSELIGRDLTYWFR